VAQRNDSVAAVGLLSTTLRGSVHEQAKEGCHQEASGEGEEGRREAADVHARTPPVSDGTHTHHVGGRALLLAIADDLMVRSRIDAAAGVAQVDVRYVTSFVEVQAAASNAMPRALLVGMAATRRPWPEIVRQVRAEPATAGLYVLAFGPHMNLDLRAKALEAGADRVVANSAFMRLLPTLLETPTAPAPDDD
jgi:hypothetical protein